MDKALKQRLVGASVLIALAVIVLPMLLGGRPDSETAEPRTIALPEQPPELSFETRRYPIGEAEEKSAEDTPPEDRVTHLPAPRQSPAEIESEDNAIEGGPDEVTAEVPDEMPKPAESLSEEESGLDDTVSIAALKPAEADTTEMASGLTAERYMVQVASFGATSNAEKLSAKLKESGYSVIMDSVKSDVGTMHRVRVGPFDSEPEAARTVTALESDNAGLRPRIVDLKPEASAQVTTPADPLVRWVVQVGSFSNSANADKLVASLRLNGLSTYQETITTSDSEIFRVRVGPFLEREEAIQTERQLRQEMSLPGVVMSAE